MGSSGVSAFVQSLNKDEELYWLALHMLPGLGTRKAGLLIQTFRTPQAVFRASRSELEAAGLAPAVAQSIVSGCSFEDAVTQQQKALQTLTEVIPITDPRYPRLLKNIFDPPTMLFARGRVELLGTLMLAVVGTRRPTTYGTTVANRLARELSAGGLTITSGMARGIDTAAHKAVLEAGGDTIAVFGCGVDEVYPSENRKLASQIATHGLVLSEFPMGTPPYPQNFPVRNRIISGLSLGVLVVEGGEYSGSAITAKLATEQNREVFAVPGNITSKQSWGPNLLIKQGAKIVQEWSDVMAELQVEDRQKLAANMRNRLEAQGKEESETSGTSLASDPFERPNVAAKAILRALRPDSAVSLDQLMATLEGTSTSEILAALFELEMTGQVRQLPGKQFLKVWTD
jgi:DNA processing protein